MNTFLLWQLHASLLIALAWVLYRVLLRNLGHFGLNRWYLLSVLPLAYLLPWLGGQMGEPVPALIHYHLPAVDIAEGSRQDGHDPAVNLFLLVYLSGAGAYLIFHFWNLSRILRLMAFSSPSQRYPGQALHNPGIRGTYAFLNRVIWNESRLAPHEQDMVMKHERVHIRQAHGVDILALEWMTVFQWFNPFIFLLRRDLREVHEFLADRGSLANDEDTSAYLRLMLNRALGGEAGNMINAFGHVSLKRRIIMMNNKNRKGSLPRYALAAAAFMLIALWAVRPVDGTAKAIASPGVTLDPVSELPLTAAQEKKTQEVKSMPQYPGGQEAMIRFLVDNIKYPEMARKKGVMGTVYVDFVVNEKGEVNSAEVARGISKEFDEEALRVVKLMNTWKPAVDKEGKSIAVQMTLPVKFELSDKKKD